ncbi:MAG: type II secretion system F family protein [Anaerolineae bacterium]|jgi:tight adherence protein B|nr:type II secretion system F family protein [Anaerolineae bacterium]
MDLMQVLLNPLLLSVVAAFAILLLFVGLSRASRSSEELIEERLDRYGVQAEDEKRGKGKKRRSAMDGLEEAVQKRGFATDLQLDLSQADLKLRVAEFAMVNVLSIVLFAMLGQFLLGSPVLALVFGVVGFFLPRLYVTLRKRRRLNQFNDQLGDTITLLANSLRSGFSIVQSMETVAQQLPPPIATEFHRVVQEIGLGLHYEQALGNMLRRVPSDDLDLMITAINIQGKVGGNLAEILDTIGHTIRERVRIKGEVRVLTAQQMISGYVLTGLPIILGIVLYMINQDYIGQMFTDPCGWIMLGTAALMVALGFLIIRKIVNIEV